MVSRLVDLWTTSPMCFQVFGFLFCNCKQSAWQLLSILYDAFLDEEIFSADRPISEISSGSTGQSISPGSDPN